MPEHIEGSSSVENAVVILRATALQGLNAVDAGIAALREKYQGATFDVSTAKGMDAAKQARLDIRNRRYKVPHIIKEQKEVLKDIAASIDTEGERIVNALMELETPIHNSIKAEEDRKAEEKAERERIESERIAKVQAAIDAMRNALMEAAGSSSDAIQALVDRLQCVPITLEGFGERAGEAQQVKLQVLDRLGELQNQARQSEEMQAQLAAQQAEIRRMNAEREAQEQAQREERERQQREAEAKLAADRAEFERQQQAAREAQAAEQKHLADQRAALDAERDAQRRAEEERHEQVRREAAERERQEREERERQEREELERREAAEARERAARDRASAAAPELAGLLKEAFATIGRRLLVDVFGHEWVDRAEAALAQVEGNQE